ncbi:hypothetical protein BDZ91DRAFT_642982, partial [Kalaharituber pfeilii]
PWWLLLPLFAVLLRTTTTLPFAIYARRVTLRIVQLQPVMTAYRHLVVRELKRGNRAADAESSFGIPLSAQDNNNNSKPAAAAPLTPAEFTSRMHKSLLAHRKSVFKRNGCQRYKLYLPLVQMPMWVLASLTLRGMTNVPQSPQSSEPSLWWSSYITPPTLPPLEPSLSTGGALWFPDLLAPDPYYALPIVLSLMLYTNMELQ